MPGRLLCLTLVLALALGLPAGVRAEPGLGGSVTLESIDLERGLAQSQGPTGQVELHYGLLSGAWLDAAAGSVRLDPGLPNEAELALGAGYARAVTGDLVLRGALTRYHYTGSVYGVDYDYDELRVAADIAGRVSAGVVYSPDSQRYAYDPEALRRRLLGYEIGGSVPLPHGLALVAGLGYYALTDTQGVHYQAWNAGVSWTSGRYELDAGYYGVSGRAKELFGTDVADSHFVVTVTVRFRIGGDGVPR